MVLETRQVVAPELAAGQMPAAVFVGEAEVELFHGGGEHGSGGAESDVQELYVGYEGCAVIFAVSLDLLSAAQCVSMD